MGLLLGGCLGLIFAVLICAIVLNLMAGHFKRQLNLGFLLAVFVVIMFIVLVIPTEDLERPDFSSILLAFTPLPLYLLQIMWFVGPLAPIRYRRVKRLRIRWMTELTRIETQNDTLDKEAELLGELSPQVRDSHSRQNVWVAEQNKKRRKYLLHKLETVF